MTTIRGAKESDWPFILSSWKRSYRRMAEEIPKGLYFDLIQERIDSLTDQGMRTAVACWHDGDSDDYILGWVAFGPGPGVVHYVYVRELERGRGVARRLVELALRDTGGDEILATHWTPPAEQYSRTKTGLFYTPSHLQPRSP